MSLTLKIALATNLVLTKAQALANGTIFQKVNTSYLDSYRVTMTQSIGKTNTAKSSVKMKIPFSYVLNGVTYNDFCYAEISATVPETCPVAVSGQIPWLIQSMGADTSYNDLVVNRAFTAA